MLQEEQFILRLVAEVPYISSLLRQHEESNDTVLPYIFMGDLANWVVEQAVKRCSIGDDPLVADAWDYCVPLLHVLDDALTEDGSGKIADLIGAGFAECVWTFCLERSSANEIVAQQAFELIVRIGSGVLARETMKWRVC